MAREKPKLVPVRFIMPNAPYTTGEIAGFAPAVAKRLVDNKRAEYYKPPEEEVAEAPPKAKPKAKPRAKSKAKKK